ncbi:MAG: coproporphyrinogen III oxidase family protein, partial [Bacteroidetes bacterium]|nr:coproporphyrinogen III oxidase family protein [Bacteroidota bacterium]
AVNAVARARQAGFTNINIDMIYALPGQSVERLLANIDKALSLETEHISAYSLIVEPGTPLNAAVEKGEIKPAAESTEADMYGIVMSSMEEHGLIHYEISNYCRPGFQCKHNLKYWNAEQYASFGPSAHSYVDGQRWWNVSSLTSYLSEVDTGTVPVSARETLTRSQLLDEYVLLRLRQGFLDTRELENLFSVSIPEHLITELEKAGYCEHKEGIIHFTRNGFKVCEEISARILSRLPDPV